MCEAGINMSANKLAGATTVKRRKGFVDADQLANNWRISNEAAKKTLEETTQRAAREFTNSKEIMSMLLLSRQVKCSLKMMMRTWKSLSLTVNVMKQSR